MVLVGLAAGLVGPTAGGLVPAAAVAPATSAWASPDATSPPLPTPDDRPSGPIARAPTGRCKAVLLVGDSVMGQVAAQVGAIYRSYGYCAHVDNAAVAGSAPAFLPGWGTWTKRLEALLRGAHWDVVVAFFQGNGAPANPDVIVHANERESLKMIDAARRSRVPIYWTLPMLSGTGCAWASPVNRNGYEAYRAWVFTRLPDLRSGVGRVNANVLTPLAGPDQRGPAHYNDSLAFRDGHQKVRLNDCLHLAGRGPAVGAYEVVYATQGLWQPCTGDVIVDLSCTIERLFRRVPIG